MPRIRNKEPFQFKQFSCSHHRSSMRIGVDAVILGAWADLQSSASILDVGCGCGVISLMAAQRAPQAIISAVDIDEASVAEAAENFHRSPWADRLTALRCSFFDIECGEGFDYIISNPPYFESGITNPGTARERARHQCELSPASLLERGAELLTEHGRIGLVVPFGRMAGITEVARESGLSPVGILEVAGRLGKEPKRAFLEFGRTESMHSRHSRMSIEVSPGLYTPEYASLCGDFYIRLPKN